MRLPFDRAGSRPPDLLSWRATRLRAAGYEAGTARSLARDGRYDIHALIELAERGCPHDLAVRIVAPLDPWPPPSAHDQ